VGKHRDELDGRLGEAVQHLLLVTRVGRARDHPQVDEPVQAVGEHVRGDALIGAGEQLVEVPPGAEHHVADDDERPLVAEHLERELACKPVAIHNW
jgi:hypothetical protein